MRRTGIIIAAIVVVALVTIFTVNAMAQDTPSSTGKPARTVTVSASATVKAAPDEAVVTLGVTTSDADSATAFSQNAKDMQAVLDALAAAGVADKDVQTLSVSLSQHTKDRGTPTPSTVFVASNSVEVTIHDLAAVGATIDAAVGAGADSVRDVRFEVSDPDTVKADALDRAVKDARSQADALAEAAGAQVVSVVTIEENSYREPLYRADMAFSAQAVPAATPIVAPDSLQASVSVSVVWEIAS